jgi:hypothetical protein
MDQRNGVNSVATLIFFDIRCELKIVYRKDKHLGRAAQTFISIAHTTVLKRSGVTKACEL